MNEPGWLQNIGDRGVRDAGAARDYVRRAAQEPRRRHGFSLECVVLRETAEPVGICGLVQRDGLDLPDLGFALLARWQGRGYAREAAEATLASAHGELSIPRVLAVTSPSNDRALRLLHALGFMDEGSVRLARDQPELLLLAHEVAPPAP